MLKSEFPFYAEPLRVYGNLFLMKQRRRLSSVWPFQKNSKDKWERVWKRWNQTDHKFIKRYVNYQQLNKLLYVETEATRSIIFNDWLVKLKHVVSVGPIECVLLVPCSAKKLLENLAFCHAVTMIIWICKKRYFTSCSLVWRTYEENPWGSVWDSSWII